MRIRLLSLYLYSLLLALLPLILWQGKRTRDNTPRLPEASGERFGAIAGKGEPLRVLILGESTAVGVGVDRIEQGLVGHFVRAYSRQTGRPVNWELIGQNGATVAELRGILAQAKVPAFEIAILAIGVNDAKALHSPQRWQCDLGGILKDLSLKQPSAKLFVSAMPPLGLFPALPQPLRFLLGLQADRLRLSSQQLIDSLPHVRHLHPDFSVAPGLFASDGFHPSEAGYERWARNLVDALVV